MAALDLQSASQTDPSEYETPDGRCRVYDVLTGEDEVRFYVEAGGNVVTNDAETVAIRFNPNTPDASDAECADALSAALDDAF